MSVFDDLPLLGGWSLRFKEIEEEKEIAPGSELQLVNIDKPGWVRFATIELDDKHTEAILKYRDPYGGVQRVILMPQGLHMGGYITNNPLGWVSVYDTENDIYRVNFMPSVPAKVREPFEVSVRNRTPDTVTMLYFTYTMIVIEDKEKLMEDARKLSGRGTEILAEEISKLREELEGGI